MTLAISSNSPSITTDYTFKTNKTVTTEQNDRLNSLYEGYNREKSHIVDIWSSEAPSTLEEFKNCFARYDSLHIDWNKDFQEYMTSRGCKNESELKTLNKTGSRDVASLREFCAEVLRSELSCTIYAKGIDEMAFRTFPMCCKKLFHVLRYVEVLEGNNVMENKNFKSKILKKKADSLDSRNSDVENAYRNVLNEFQQDNLYTRKQIIDIVNTKYHNETSILPSDYCYNRINLDIANDFEKRMHIFEYVKKNVYRFLGENVSYTGDIEYKNIVVGSWKNGNIVYLDKNKIKRK